MKNTKNEMVDTYFIVTNQETEKAFWLCEYGLSELYDGKAKAAVIHIYISADDEYIESAIFDEIPSWQDIANADIWEEWTVLDTKQFFQEMLAALGEPNYSF